MIVSDKKQLEKHRFHGKVHIRTWFGKYLGVQPGREHENHYHFKRDYPDYSDIPYEWEMGVSSHGGYYFQSGPLPGWGQKRQYLMCNLNDHKLLVFNPGSEADTWETFFLERFEDGYALKNKGSNQYLCAEPMHREVHLVADRKSKREWEKFHIQIVWQASPVSTQAPARTETSHHVHPPCSEHLSTTSTNESMASPPPASSSNTSSQPQPHTDGMLEPMNFFCGNCYCVIALCSGGKQGEEHVLVDDPKGGWCCPKCRKPFYRVAHFH